jgi:FtsZ-binding cell division protein ZapB
MLSDADPRVPLENEKLRLEIRELRRPWWQKPGYLAVVLPALISTLAVYVAYNKGYFDNQSAALEAKRERIQLDIERFTDQKDKLTKANSYLAAENKTLLGENDRIKGERTRLQSRLIELDHQHQHVVKLLNEKETELSNKQDLLAMAPLNTSIERLMALTYLESKDVVGVQHMMQIALGSEEFLNQHRVADEVQAIAAELRVKDKYQARKIALVKNAAEQKNASPAVKALLESVLRLSK